jgi:hypothetical protein
VPFFGKHECCRLGVDPYPRNGDGEHIGNLVASRLGGLFTTPSSTHCSLQNLQPPKQRQLPSTSNTALKTGTGDNVLQLTPSTPPPLWCYGPLCYRKVQRRVPWSSNHEIQPGEQINSKVVKVNGHKELANYPRHKYNQNDHHISRTHQKNMCIERLSGFL